MNYAGLQIGWHTNQGYNVNRATYVIHIAIASDSAV